MNKPVSKDEFESICEPLKDRHVLQEAMKRFDLFRKTFPQRYHIEFKNENISGNYLVNCKNAEHCFDSRGIWAA